MSHDDILQKFSRDRYAVKTSGIKIEKVSEDYALCSMEITDNHLNGNDCVMGGAIFTLADYCFGVAANYSGCDTVTLDSSISYLSPTVGPVLFAEAVCRKSGRSAAFYDITVTDSNRKTVAIVKTTGYRKAQ